MESAYKTLGSFVRLVDERNRRMTTTRILGINIDKYFMPSVANVIGTDLRNYKLLRKGLFACNPMHVGRDERLPIALYTDDIPAIVSPAYFVFEIADKSVLDEYLMMWFLRPDFDRLCWFKTDASVRGGIAWDDLSRIEIPVPPIDAQRKLVYDYKVISDRIALKRRINQNLQQQAQAIFFHMFPEVCNSDTANGVLSDIANITMGQSPDGESYNENGVGTVFFQGRAEFGFRFPTIRLFTTEPKRMAICGDTLMSVRAPVGDLNVAHEDCCIGRGLAAIHSKNNCPSFSFYTVLSLREQLDIFNAEGTVFGSINRDALNEMPVFIPSEIERNRFENIVAPIDQMILKNHDEKAALISVRDILLSRLASES